MRRRRVDVADLPAVPAELVDVAAPVWRDRRAYRSLMADHGWPLPVCERMGVPASPGRRRAAAVAGWASRVGVVTVYGFPDWHRLARLL